MAWIAATSPRHFLLIRKHLSTGELAYHYCHIPAGQPIQMMTLVRVACLRWPVEEDLCATRRSVISPAEPGETGGRFLGLMAYPAPKGQGDKSMPGNQRPGSGAWDGALGDPRDMAKAGLLEAQSPAMELRILRNGT